MRIFVSGYWANNLGDDLFLKILCNKYKNIQFEIDVKKEFAAPFKNIDNLYINYVPNSKWKIMRFLKKSFNLIIKITIKKAHGFFISFGPYTFVTSLPDAYVEIGGSIFMLKEGENISKNTRFRQRIKLSDSISNYFVIGSNFGPYSSADQLKSYSVFLNKITDTCFRDEKSKALFSELSNVRSESDVILSYKDNGKNINSKKHILISIIDIIYKNDVGTENLIINAEDYENKIVEISNYYAEKGENVILFSFCDFQGDNVIAERIHKKIKSHLKSKVQIKSHNESIEESLELIKLSKKIIATRFHAMILGWLFRIPTYVISYSKKTEDVINWSFPEQNFIKYQDINKLNLETIENSFSVISEKRLEKLKLSSNRQFNSLNNFIELGDLKNGV